MAQRFNLLPIIFPTIIFLSGCNALQGPVKETADSFEVKQGTELVIILRESLSCNTNKRGDVFTAKLKEQISLGDRVVLPAETGIRGLITGVNKYVKLGDRASLLLVFDQIAFPDGRVLPMDASLDTDKGASSIRVKGKEMQDAKVLGKHAVVGALAGRALLEEKGAEKGILVGAAVGMGAVFLSNSKAITLPEGTEFNIRLNENLIIPK